MSKKYKIPCSWIMYGFAEVEADSFDEAVEIVESSETNLPEGSYVEASFEVDADILDEFKEQQDAK